MPDALLEALRNLYLERERELRETYNRSLPFQDGLFDRWERAKRLGFGAQSSVYNSALIFGDVQVGDNTWVGPYTILDGSAGLEIGRFCSISSGVQIYTHDTIAWALTAGEAAHNLAPVTIGDCCYIGSLSIVSAGVTIGRQSVVAANSFVNKDVPEGAIVGGTPARILGRVRVNGSEIQLEYERD